MADSDASNHQPHQPAGNADRSLPAASARRLSLSFGLVAYAFLVTMLGTTLPTPLYPLYREWLGFSNLMVTVIFAVYAAGVVAALLLAGRWSDQVGRRRMLLAGIAFSAASALTFLLADGLAWLLLGRVLSGISAGIVTGTATVAIVELATPPQRRWATLAATAVNMGGLGCGPLLAGLLADYAPLPLRLCFIVDLLLLAVAAAGVAYAPETVNVAARPRLWPPQRLKVPAQVRGVFVSAAIAGFAGFAVLGLFTAVAPAFLAQLLQRPSHALAGLVVFVMFAASTLGQLSLERVPQRWALPSGCLILAAGAALIGSGLAGASLGLLALGALVAGFGQGLGFRAGMVAVTGASPAERRAEVASTFFVVLYVAISIPVIGVGLVAQMFGLRTAGIGFAIAVAALALVALLSLLHRRSANAA